MARKKITDLLGLELTNLQSSVEPEMLSSSDEYKSSISTA